MARAGVKQAAAVLSNSRPSMTRVSTTPQVISHERNYEVALWFVIEIIRALLFSLFCIFQHRRALKIFSPQNPGLAEATGAAMAHHEFLDAPLKAGTDSSDEIEYHCTCSCVILSAAAASPSRNDTGRRHALYNRRKHFWRLLKVNSTDPYSDTSTLSFGIRSHKRQGWLERSAETSD